MIGKQVLHTWFDTAEEAGWTLQEMMDEIEQEHGDISVDEWHSDRAGGIGGSDAGAVVGCSPYRDALAVWAEKRGLLVPDEPEDMDAVEMGHALEPVVLSRFAAKGPGIREAELWVPRLVVVDEERPWLRCTPDALVIDEDGLALVQIKTAAESKRGQDAPVHHELQCRHEMAATGIDRCYLVTLYGGRYLEWQLFRREAMLEAWLLDAEAKLWAHVAGGTDLPEDLRYGTLDTRVDTLAKLHPDDDGEIVELPPELVSVSDTLHGIRRQLRELRDAEESLEDQIRVAIGEHAGGVLANGTGTWWWRTIQCKGYTVDPGSYRKLTFEKQKGYRQQ
jgi:putative phage-type endonuclease